MRNPIPTAPLAGRGGTVSMSPRISVAHPPGTLATFLLLGVALSACGNDHPMDPTRPQMVLVTNEVSGDVTVIDTTTDAVVGTWPVGKRPRGIRVGPDGSTAYVALSGTPRSPPGTDESTLPPPDRTADGIGVVDIATGALRRVLRSGQDPESFDLSPDGALVYVSNEETSEMSVVDVASGEVVHRVPVGEEPEGVATRPGGVEVYVTSEGEDHVVVLDRDTNNVVATIPTAARPRGIAFTPDGARAFVTAENGAAITVIDTDRHVALHNLHVDGPGPDAPARPMGAVVSPDGATLYVTNGRAGTLSAIDVASESLVRSIAGVGARPWGVALTRDGAKLYTANGPSGDVSVIETATGQIIKRIPAGDSPWGVAITP
jgi:YVTN family beta-propeller protein